MTSFADARTAMVDCQVRPSDVTRYSVIDAMLSVPREDFVPMNFRDVAYVGEHIEFAENRVVFDPRVTAKMLDEACVSADDAVLHIGCNFGYVSALLGHIAEFVVGIDDVAETATQATEALARLGADNVVIETGPLVEGAREHGPFDLMIFEGGLQVLPDALVEQVKNDGRIVAIFVENGVGQCRVGHKTANGVTWRRAFDATSPLLPGFESEKAFDF